MKNTSFLFSFCAAGLLLAASSGQTQTSQPAAAGEEKAMYTCMYLGAPSREPVGDQSGHDVREVHYTCAVKGGAMDGAVSSTHGVYEWRGTEGRLLTADGILRKPGSLVVYTANDGAGSIVMQDGKPVGARNTGTATVKFASGAAAGWAGRTFRYSSWPGPNGQFFVETSMPSP